MKLTAKDTNPKDAVGTSKAPLSTVSAAVILEVGLAMLEGARKYGRHNYRVAGVRGSVYYDAALRHLLDWWEGTDIDPDSGMSHITKAIASLVVLRDAMINKKLVDDRPPKLPAGWMEKLSLKAKEIIAKYPDAKQAYVEGDQNDQNTSKEYVFTDQEKFIRIRREAAMNGEPRSVLDGILQGKPYATGGVVSHKDTSLFGEKLTSEKCVPAGISYNRNKHKLEIMADGSVKAVFRKKPTRKLKKL